MKEDIGMEKKKYSIKEDFSMLALLIIPVGVAVNIVGGQLASILKLPMYLDTIGTIFAAMLCGPWVGAVTGGLTNVVTGIANPVNFAFIPVNVIAGLVTGFLARKQMFSVWWKWLISMFVMAWVSIIVSAPIVVLVYGGVTGGGTSIITAAAMAAGANIWAAFFDKVIVMAKKKVVRSGTPKEIFWDFESLEHAMLKQPYVSRVCKALNIGGNVISIADAVEGIMSQC